MSSIKHHFKVLNIIGDNYITWNNNLLEYLACEGLDTILEGDEVGPPIVDQRELLMRSAKVNRIIKHHLDDGLQIEYSNSKDPKVLWETLKKRFGHQKKVLLPSLMDQWNRLRFQDYKSVVAYNSAMHQIISQLEFCGVAITEEQKLEKTFSTFHASQVLLQQQYRMGGFIEYSELVSALLLAEQNNELLIKNSQVRPPGTLALPEVNATTYNRGRGNRGLFQGRGNFQGRGSYVQFQGRNDYNRFYGRGRGRTHGRNHFRGRGRGRGHMNYFIPPTNDQINKTRKGKGLYIQEGPSSNHEDFCYRCGKKGHWSKTCRTPEHLCKRFKEGKGKEVNFNEIEPENDTTYLEAADFVEGSNEMD